MLNGKVFKIIKINSDSLKRHSKNRLMSLGVSKELGDVHSEEVAFQLFIVYTIYNLTDFVGRKANETPVTSGDFALDQN